MQASEAWWNALNGDIANIRDCIKNFCERDTSGHVIGPYPRKHSLEDFENAYIAKDVDKLMQIMDDAWFRAPDRREVYKVPGFSTMCDLLDGTYDSPDISDVVEDEDGVEIEGEEDGDEIPF